MMVYLGKSQVLIGQKSESLERFVNAQGPALNLIQDGPNSLRLDIDAPARDWSRDYSTGVDTDLRWYTLIEWQTRARG